MSWQITERLREIVRAESGAVQKDWGGKTSVALVFPGDYRIGMGNLAIHALYGILNAQNTIVCERAFLPAPRELAAHQASGTPILTLESQRPLAEFDCVAMSISFENDALGILPILEAARIPHRAEARGDDGPILIAGGAAPTLNPLPILPLFEAVLLGEFEASAQELLPLLSARLPKRELLAALAGIRGVITNASPPARSELAALARRHAEDLDAFPTQTVIYAPAASFGDMHLIEVERGCPRHCRFCATPVIYGKPRRRSTAAVLAMVERGLPHRRRMGLVGADILSHPGFAEIAAGIHARGATFSPASVRADEIDEERARLMVASGHRSVALGVEAGSERLRRLIGKGLSDERILAAAEQLAKAGIGRLRLYFMIGLPEEGEEDIAAIAALACRVRDVLRSAMPRGRRATSVDLTVTPFVPKPGTPFGEAPFAGERALKGMLKRLTRLVAKEEGLALHGDSVVEARIEAFLAGGDVGAVDFLEEAHRVRSPRAALRRVARVDDDLR
jgi:radical SAM superfamily enzyme YgiQ (UPF0313 family)